MIPLKSPKNRLLEVNIYVFKFMYLEEYFTDRRSQGVKSKFMHTLLESKRFFAIEGKAIVSCFVKNVAFLLGHPVVCFKENVAKTYQNSTNLPYTRDNQSYV